MLTGIKSRTLKTTTLVPLASLALTLGVVACDKASSDTANSTTPAPAGSATLTGATTTVNDPLAKVENRANIKEYPDETKFNPPRDAQLITGFAVEARESPRGDVISSVEATQQVKEIARDSHGDYYLVLMNDPKDSSKQMAGWVYKDALENNFWAQENTGTAASPSKAKSIETGKTEKLACARGQSHVRTSIDFCAKTCKDDSGCDKKAGEVCDGLGFEVHESNGKLTNANYCLSSTAPGATGVHAADHGSSAPLDQMNKNYDPNNPAGVTPQNSKKNTTPAP